MSSPETGARSDLSFSGMGVTLRFLFWGASTSDISLRILVVVVVVVRGGMQVLWLVNAEVETRWRNVKACQLRPLPVRLVSPYAL